MSEEYTTIRVISNKIRNYEGAMVGDIRISYCNHNSTFTG
jgi:hypothetical protein